MAHNYHTAKHYPVRFCDCNAEGRLHLHRLMDYAQDCDDANCAFFETTTEMLRIRDVCWILIANTLDFSGQWPGANDTLIVESWSSGLQGVRFYRENRYYRNEVDEAHLFGTGYSEWILCSLVDHRPLRPSAVVDVNSYNAKSDCATDKLNKISRLKSFVSHGAPNQQLTYQVGYGDLDANIHLHNTHFARLALDATSQLMAIDPLRHKLEIRKFDIQFIKEVNYLGNLAIFTKCDPDDPRTILVEGKIINDNETSFLAAIVCDISAFED